jgi:plasmid stability protein
MKQRFYENVIRALKERAGAHGRSAEAEHREILASALVRPRRRSFAEVLAPMPDVGLDADFERLNAGFAAFIPNERLRRPRRKSFSRQV